ncbi:MAG: hypothetical protein LBB93_01195 [Elusimicrobiota bacterium]|jgi:hypothetical protein|nr:hypothetical protein [Elusimicrobiota bacterium]
MSIFEAIMIASFGCAWPASIYKSYVSRNNNGKSLAFLIIVLIGYTAGIIHKVMYSFDLILGLYILIFLMVLTDLCLYVRNYRIMGIKQ